MKLIIFSLLMRLVPMPLVNYVAWQILYLNKSCLNIFSHVNNSNYHLTDTRDEHCETFSFGILLVGLIAKKVCGDEEIEREKAPLCKWVQSEF